MNHQLIPKCHEKTENDQLPHILGCAHKNSAGTEQYDAGDEDKDPRKQ